MKVTCSVRKLRLDIPFTIFRGTTAVKEICIAEIEHEGVTGYGEASPSAYYGDCIEAAARVINESEAVISGRDIGDDPFALELISRGLGQRFPESPSGRAAVEMAVYDIAGKLAGLPLFRLLGLSGMAPPRTSYTVGVEDADLIRGRLDRIRSFPILKVKLGFGREEDLLELLSNETDSVLRADVNEGWDFATALERMARYQEKYSIEFFEQPLPKTDIEGYRRLMAETGSTVIVDESVTCKQDVIKCAGLAHGVNIKLMKSGGIREALAMVTAARAVGLRVMLGCMIESSVGISAAAQIAPLVDYCDLDGNLLIADDPFEGVRGAGGVLSLGDAPGLGVRPSA
jgi:L-alanine-DL-glutamate epimerase-like enolase superfamily enzyme